MLWEGVLAARDSVMEEWRNFRERSWQAQQRVKKKKSINKTSNTAEEGTNTQQGMQAVSLQCLLLGNLNFCVSQ